MKLKAAHLLCIVLSITVICLTSVSVGAIDEPTSEVNRFAIRTDKNELLFGESLVLNLFASDITAEVMDATVTLLLNGDSFAMPTAEDIIADSSCTVVPVIDNDAKTITLTITSDDFSTIDPLLPMVSITMTSLQGAAPLEGEEVAGITSITLTGGEAVFDTAKLKVNMNPKIFVKGKIKLNHTINSEDGFKVELLKDGEFFEEIALTPIESETQELTLTPFSPASLPDGKYSIKVSGNGYAPVVSTIFSLPDTIVGANIINFEINNLFRCDIATTDTNAVAADGIIDIFDFNMLCSNFTATIDKANAQQVASDINGDGKVDINDVKLLVSALTDQLANGGMTHE